MQCVEKPFVKRPMIGKPLYNSHACFCCRESSRKRSPNSRLPGALPHSIPVRLGLSNALMPPPEEDALWEVQRSACFGPDSEPIRTAIAEEQGGGRPVVR